MKSEIISYILMHSKRDLMNYGVQDADGFLDWLWSHVNDYSGGDCAKWMLDEAEQYSA